MKTDTINQTPEDVLNELRSLVSEAEKLLAQPAGRACSCDISLEDLRERFEAAQERVTAMYRRAKEKVATGAKVADLTVRENPYQSMAIALGIGLVAGVLIGRRNSAPTP